MSELFLSKNQTLKYPLPSHEKTHRRIKTEYNLNDVVTEEQVNQNYQIREF